MTGARWQIDRLWRLAGQEEPTRFSWRDLVRLTAELQALDQAFQQGRLRLVTPAENS